MSPSSVVISNGFGQFHLARLAEVLERDHKLGLFLTGAYPGHGPTIPDHWKGAVAPLRRFEERRIDLGGESVRSCWSAELPHQVSQRLIALGRRREGNYLGARAFSLYQKWASRVLREAAPHADFYHYRAGLGGPSVDLARKHDLPTLCDHSIAHPRILRDLLNSPGLESEGYWERVTADVDAADALLVNSDFVKDTCVEAGIAPERIHVAYTAVDPGFSSVLDGNRQSERFEDVSAVFAGTVERRKGADTVLRSVSKAPTSWPVAWHIVGDWMPDMTSCRKSIPPHAVVSPKMSRKELAKLLASSSIFVFPSRAEGSARVVSEALVAGCYVITTKNAGSVLRDGIDGRIVGVNEPDSILQCVDEYLTMTPEQRQMRSEDTALYARERLSERRYAQDVYEAYRRVS